MWSEASGELGWVWSKGREAGAGLGLRTLAWHPALQQLCSTLQAALGQAHTSLTAYTGPALGEDRGAFNRWADSGGVSEAVGAVTGDTLAALLDRLAEGGCNALLRARLAQALLPLWPALPTLLGPGRAPGLVVRAARARDTQLAAWLATLTSQFRSDLERIQPGAGLNCLPAWDRIIIAETGDSGEEVKSEILVPASPALPLHNALLSVAAALHAGHPASLPAPALAPATTAVLLGVLDHYSTLAATPLHQTFALQLLFDLQLVEVALLGRGDREQLGSRLTAALAALEANIDPFDLSVFSPHLEERVRGAGARLSVALGPLVPSDRLPGLTGARGGAGRQEPHSLLPGPGHAPARFQLLPVPTPRSGRTAPAPTLPATRSRPAPQSASVQQTAANFFGSMSWFGSGTG